MLLRGANEIASCFVRAQAPEGTSSIGCGNLHFSFPADLADAALLHIEKEHGMTTLTPSMHGRCENVLLLVSRLRKVHESTIPTTVKCVQTH